MMDFDKWLKEILKIVWTLSSEDFQRESWFGKCAWASSPTEIYCGLYDDLAVDLLFATYRERFSEPQLNQWSRLNVMLNEYARGSRRLPSDETIFDDPEWHLIRRAACELLREFPNIDPQTYQLPVHGVTGQDSG
jgi:hypothetical protein